MGETNTEYGADQIQILEGLPNGILVHGGGWKKLAGEAVSPGEFKARVAAATGVERVSNYYGMAEQTGCIYMECPQGHLHCDHGDER